MSSWLTRWLVPLTLPPNEPPNKTQSVNPLIGEADESVLPGYAPPVELRQLEAFAALAADLHFGRAAARLHMGQPTLSESIRRLERELGTPLFARTTRHVALTSAGEELLARTKVILDEVASAVASVRQVAAGDTGTVRVGITPPVAPVLAPHLRTGAAEALPGVVLDYRQFWLPALATAVAEATIDVAITIALVPDVPGVVSELLCGEPLLVGLRTQHPLAAQDTVALSDLATRVLGVPNPDLFPAWALCQQQALRAAAIDPPTVQLEATDLSASAWTQQDSVDWVLLIGSLSGAHRDTAIRPVDPVQLAPYTLQWSPDRVQSAAVARFVDFALSSPLPPGWIRSPGHERYDGS
jgi:DNA-binding transcriptional LysR family regulator